MRDAGVPTESEVLVRATALLEALFPSDWKLRRVGPAGVAADQPDVILELEAPDGRLCQLVVGVKSPLFASNARQAELQLRDYINQHMGEVGSAIGIVAAPYINPSRRQWIADQDLGYIDLTGNVRIHTTTPSIYVLQHGADRNPWPTSSGLQSLKGRASGSAVRALVDFVPPFGVRQLASAGEVSAPTLSRVIDLLRSEGLVETNADGTVERLEWPGVIRRWALDYSVLETNTASWYLDPRGADHAIQAIRDETGRYAATGIAAVPEEVAPPPASAVTVYSDSPSALADRLRLRATESGANVALLEPYSDAVFLRVRTRQKDGLRLVGMSQLAADLLTGSNRDPSVAEDLLEWMSNNEERWRAKL